LNFCGFEDDPAFDLRWLISSFGDLDWQTDFVDPDGEPLAFSLADDFELTYHNSNKSRNDSTRNRPAIAL
jgi:hypothetical protein